MVKEPPAVPRASSDPLPEQAAFLRPFAPLFRNRQSWHSVERYLTDLPRKNCATIAAAVAGTSTERLQHLLTDAAWDPAALDQARVQFLSPRSPAGGILVVDDTGLPKRGGPRWEWNTSTRARWASEAIARRWSAPNTSRMTRRRRPRCTGR